MRTLCALVLAGMLMAWTPPAQADDQVGLSPDGQHWTDQLRRPLFDADQKWVPGDSEVRSFYVRDDGPTDARMTVQVLLRDADSLIPLDDVELSARAHRGRWRALDVVGSGTALLQAPLADGETVRVDLRARLRWAAKNDAQTGRLPLDLVVTLTQASAGHTDGFIPGTGNTVESWLVLLAGLLVGGGVAVLVVRRRREQADG
ncbi:MAG TPA: LPXTG cell wall anchor domain-containing protein [Nocardioides sp.]|nr:LPXTG cell wall anchor domain-containing protein [Nocardioides sp.]